MYNGSAACRCRQRTALFLLLLLPCCWVVITSIVYLSEHLSHTGQAAWGNSVTMGRPPTNGHRFRHNCWPVLLLLAVTFQGSADGQSECKKFSDLEDKCQYKCEQVCVDHNYFKDRKVFGTQYYSEDSDVCMAAVHAGTLGEEGGTVTITRHRSENLTITGTLRNRVMSESRKRGDGSTSTVFSFSEMTPANVSGLAVDVVIVHNSYYDGGSLHWSCIAEDSTRSLSRDNVLGWTYDVVGNIGDVERNVVHVVKNKWSTSRVFGCRGRSAATDVLAVIQTPDQYYTAASSTFRVTQGEKAILNITKKKTLPNEVFCRRLPDGWTYSGHAQADTSLPLTFDNVSLANAGIYILGNNIRSSTFTYTKWLVEKKGAYFHLIVQDCASGRYGAKCEKWCPDCENGGLCHPQTGSCICAPGFNGTFCQTACNSGYFGSSCALQCSRTSLHFSPPYEGSCHGLTVCLPKPYGCSCAAGHRGPLCIEACSKGWYGAECSLQCDHCVNQTCDRTSGRCIQGCVDGVACDDEGRTLDLPRLRCPPAINVVTDIAAYLSFTVWENGLDDGSGNFTITGYDIEVWSEVNNTWTTWRHLPLASINNQSSPVTVKVDGLFPGYRYAVKVLVQTENGTVDGSSNKRVHNSTFTTLCTGPDVLDFSVTNITDQSAILQWRGKHQLRCAVTYDVMVWKADGGDGGLIYNGTTSNITHVNLTDLEPHVNYEANITAKPSHTGLSLQFSTASYAPASPKLVLGENQRGSTTLNPSWTRPIGSYEADMYTVTYKLLQHKACSSSNKTAPEEQEKMILNVTWNGIILENLHSYSTYNVCVEAINDDGVSEPTCELMDTLPSVPDNILLSDLQCQQRDYGVTMECEAILSGGCEAQNGPNFEIVIRTQAYLKCNNSLFHYEASLSPIDDRITFTLPSGFPHGQDSIAAVYIRNIMGSAQNFTHSFSITEKSPEEVKNVTAVPLSPRKVRVLWNDPCPPNGVITSVSYRYVSKDHEHQLDTAPWMNINAGDTVCNETSPNYDRCLEIDHLTPNTHYVYQVRAGTEGGFGPETGGTFVFQETKPGKPYLADVTSGEDSVSLVLQLPEDTGGLLLNCTAQIPLHHITRIASVDQGVNQVSFQLVGLTHSKMYNLEMFCCNTAKCGDVLEEAVATLLTVTPELSGDLRVAGATEAEIKLKLPSFGSERNVSRSLVVMVQRVSSEQRKIVQYNFTSKFLSLRDIQSSSGERRKREAPLQTEAHEEDTYIAAVISPFQDLKEFVVGDGRRWGDHYNYPLAINRPYMVAVVAHIRLQDEERFSEKRLDAEVTLRAATYGFDWAKFVLAISVVILIIIITVGLIKYRLERMREDDCRKNNLLSTYNQEDATVEFLHDNEIQEGDQSPSHALVVTPAPPAQQGAQAVATQPEAIYENLIPSNKEENIYENLQPDHRVPESQLEAYLNKVIGSQNTIQEFMSVAPNVGKSQSDGELPENKKKNRYRNNLPYNETRVKLSLSVQDSDQGSDYINANHVHGFGGSLQYIAAQGPKDTNKPTIGDFWRMVMEQGVTAIIMVANFVEGGKSKVGVYFKHREKLKFEDFTVKVLKRDKHCNHHISTIQVMRKERSHTVTHYHYTSWPDHGVPTEPHSLATMIRYIIDSHSQGTVVVHCSAGIGRTGTVLFVMLMHEMLRFHGRVDPLEVLQRLRDCRARLVENVAQYNLGLCIFDELLYGKRTSIPGDNLDKQMKTQLSQSHELYQRAAALPSSLTYRGARCPDISKLNRSTTVLPADGCNVFLNIENGDQTSQYINAIRIHGLNYPSKMLVTEHPLPATLDRFWRMVVEQKCASIVLINSYDGLESEFPQLIPEKNKEECVGQFNVHTQDVINRDSLTIYTIKVLSGKVQDVHQTVVVYQIAGWPYKKELPASLKVLLSVSDMVLRDHRKPEAGPVLLCCGNGVTGCGLMAGVLLVVERLMEQQVVDAYRTLVHLRRARTQFITSQKQFDVLYEAASLYLANYSTYVNL